MIDFTQPVTTMCFYSTNVLSTESQVHPGYPVYCETYDGNAWIFHHCTLKGVSDTGNHKMNLMNKTETRKWQNIYETECGAHSLIYDSDIEAKANIGPGCVASIPLDYKHGDGVV